MSSVIERPSGIGFQFSDEQVAVAHLVREFAQREIAPHIARWDKEHTFVRELYAKLADAGILGMTIPEEYGGGGSDAVTYALVVEELAKADAGAAVTFSVHAMVAAAIEATGTPEQKRRCLPKMASGEWLGAFALTEPESGSDAAALRTRAERDGDEYVITGRKQWCTNGGYSGVVMVMARAGGTGAEGISSFLVENGTPGMVVERVTEKLGIHTSNTVDLALDGVRVGAGAMLGAPGRGFRQALQTLNAGRIGIAAQACGILAACLKESIAFARERRAFGKAIGAYEGISFKIARMQVDLDAARLLMYRAAWLKDQGRDFAVAASEAKLFASEAARRQSAEAVQIHGGYGYTTEFAVERHYRDAKITEIYEGTSEIHQIIVARSLLGKLD
ncbi:MAG TPA: acyl-CoA dehydrogenase family protein [Candidatus Dormibacteraeota bacterium]|nr:acyl-CoA dehydrogenase family protein [Candidatus Dormibacteraeota bacterium]